MTLEQNGAPKQEILETGEKPVEAVKPPETSAEIFARATKMIDDANRRFDESTGRNRGQVEKIASDPDTQPADVQTSTAQIDTLDQQGKQVVADAKEQITQTIQPAQAEAAKPENFDSPPENERIYMGAVERPDGTLDLSKALHAIGDTHKEMKASFERNKLERDAKLASDLEIPESAKPGTPEYTFYQTRNEKIIVEKAAQAEAGSTSKFKYSADYQARIDSLDQQLQLLSGLTSAKTKPSPEVAKAYQRDLENIIATEMTRGWASAYKEQDPSKIAEHQQQSEDSLRGVDFQKVSDNARAEAERLRQEMATSGETEELKERIQEEEEAAREYQRYADIKDAFSPDKSASAVEDTAQKQEATQQQVVPPGKKQESNTGEVAPVSIPETAPAPQQPDQRQPQVETKKILPDFQLLTVKPEQPLEDWSPAEIRGILIPQLQKDVDTISQRMKTADPTAMPIQAQRRVDDLRGDIANLENYLQIREGGPAPEKVMVKPPTPPTEKPVETDQQPEPAQEIAGDATEPVVETATTTPEIKTASKAEAPKVEPEDPSKKREEEVNLLHKMSEISNEIMDGNVSSERAAEITREITSSLEGNYNFDDLTHGARIAQSLKNPSLARQLLGRAEASNRPGGKITPRVSAEYSCIVARMLAESGDIKGAQASLEKAQGTYPELGDGNTVYSGAIKAISKRSSVVGRLFNRQK
ncbi:MAG: hypothetical protein NTY30_02020 [Candidatus Berkelbacteria bacterium]|nr:hypothetical protein [Candidatus Berkelbacteria bacterium]